MRKRTKILSLIASATMMVCTLTLSAVTAFADWISGGVDFPDKDEYAYSFVVVGDPQIIARSDAKNGTDNYAKMYKWIVDNKAAHNIQFVLNMGDIIDSDGYTEGTTRPEWEVAVNALEQLETKSIPYTLVRGNHDNRSKYYDYFFGDEAYLNRTASDKGQYEAKYTTAKGTKSDYMEQSTLVDCFPKDDYRSARNTAHEYTVGNVNYLVVALDCGAQDAELAWANELVGQEKYANYNVIVQTHAYMNGDGKILDGSQGLSMTKTEERDGYTDSTNANRIAAPDSTLWIENAKLNVDEPFNDGSDMWDGFIKKHANITTVLCGHVSATDIVRRTHVGENGNVVQEIVVNPQDLDVLDNDGDGTTGKAGADADDMTGLVAIFYCAEDGTLLKTRYYSTLQGKFYGEENQIDFSADVVPWGDKDGITFTSDLHTVRDDITESPVSLEAVVKRASGTGKEGFIVGNYRSTNYSAWCVSINASDEVRLYTLAKGKSAKEVKFSTDITGTTYKHIAVTYDGAYARLYVDGVQAEEKAFTAYTSEELAWSTAALPMVIGGDQRTNNTKYFNGEIKAVALYSDCRTADEIAISAKHGINVKDEGLIAGYNFSGKSSDAKIYENVKPDGRPLISATYQVEDSNETYTDIADYGVYENEYATGIEHTSTKAYTSATYELWDTSKKGDTPANAGIEFRMKSKETIAELKEIMAAQSYTGVLWMFANVRLGYSFFQIYVASNLSSIGIQMGHFNNGMKYLARQDNLIAFEDNAEYVFRFTRTALDAEIDNGYGALVRVYLGKVNPETNQPEAGWDATPVYEDWAWYDRNSTSKVCGISVETGGINNKYNEMPHTLTISSNKYVGIKTVAGETETFAKIERGKNYTFPVMQTPENVLHVGWTKGAATYSEEDYAAAGASVTVNKSGTYTPMKFGLQASKAASLRFRQRIVNGQALPVEVSLKWNVTATDTENLINYFGDLKFGYKVAAANGKVSKDIAAEKYSVDGNVYSYSVVQSNIGEYIDMKFTCQAYVEVCGMKYYTAQADMETDGRSVAIIAQRAVDDARDEATTQDGYAYTNAINTANGVKYHYLTQFEYNLLASIIAD